jgi:hypothetical protein
MSDIHDDRAALFANLESAEAQPKFWDRVADDVDWTVEGTHALCGRYRSKAYPVPHQSTLAGTVPYLTPQTSRSTPALPRRPARPPEINRHDVTSWRSGPQRCYIVAVALDSVL